MDKLIFIKYLIHPPQSGQFKKKRIDICPIRLAFEDTMAQTYIQIRGHTDTSNLKHPSYCVGD